MSASARRREGVAIRVIQAAISYPKWCVEFAEAGCNTSGFHCSAKRIGPSKENGPFKDWGYRSLERIIPSSYRDHTTIFTTLLLVVLFTALHTKKYTTLNRCNQLKYVCVP